jgi:hypothetical protein
MGTNTKPRRQSRKHLCFRFPITERAQARAQTHTKLLRDREKHHLQLVAGGDSAGRYPSRLMKGSVHREVAAFSRDSKADAQLFYRPEKEASLPT